MLLTLVSLGKLMEAIAKGQVLAKRRNAMCIIRTRSQRPKGQHCEPLVGILCACAGTSIPCAVDATSISGACAAARIPCAFDTTSTPCVLPPFFFVRMRPGALERWGACAVRRPA